MADLEPHEPIVQRAVMALLGFSPDWRADLLPLLRSDEPIPPFLRDIIADAIEGCSFTGVKLRLEGQGRLSGWLEGVKDRRRYMDIGATVAALEDQRGLRKPELFEVAAGETSESEGTCIRSYYYWTHCRKWMATAQATGAQYRAMDDDQLASIYHFARAAKGTPLNGPEYDRTATDTVDWLNENVRPRLGQNAVKVIWAMCHILEPMKA